MRNHDHSALDYRKNLDQQHRQLTVVEDGRNRTAEEKLVNDESLQMEEDNFITFTKKKEDTDNKIDELTKTLKLLRDEV